MVHLFLNQNAVSQKVAVRVQRLIKDRMTRQKRLTEEDVEGFKLLSAVLRSELRYEVFSKHLLTSQLYNVCDSISTNSILALCFEAVKIEVLGRGDTLFSFEQEAGQAHLVVHGSLEYTIPQLE